ncbi:esterase/lipase family protein [Actinomycetota bacterium]
MVQNDLSIAAALEADEHVTAPSLALMATEPARAVIDFNRTLLRAPYFAGAPRGDGHPVLVLPGLMADDSSTFILRMYLKMLGYRVYKWHLGRNVGPTDAVLAGMPAAVKRIAKRNRSKVSIIGWSLGGIYARGLAHDHPDSVRDVITLGSPYRLHRPSQSRARSAYDRFGHLHAVGSESGAVPRREVTAKPLPVPATSIYSTWDGIVAWEHCIEPTSSQAENIRVLASHIGLGHNPQVLWAVADRLAQPEGEWEPFEAPAIMRAFYPEPHHPRQHHIDHDHVVTAFEAAMTS